jgi:putative membrane protein
MVFLIVNWVLGAFALVLVAHLFPGFRVTEFQSALLAAGVVGLISAAIALAFKRVMSPAGLAISGTLLVIVDSFLFRVMALVVPGFAMLGFYPAFAGAFVLLALHLCLLWLQRTRHHAVQSESLLRS